MKCFTIDECGATPGIQIDKYDHMYFVVAGQGRSMEGLTISRTLRDLIDQVMSEGKLQRLPLLERCSMRVSARDEVQLIPEQFDDGTALVKVAIGAGEGGTLTYTAATAEMWAGRQGRTFPVFDPFITPIDAWRGMAPSGIEVLAIGSGPGGEFGAPEALLRVKQHAAFRLRRTGDIGDAAPFMTVVCRPRGRELGIQLITPARYRKAA